MVQAQACSYYSVPYISQKRDRTTVVTRLDSTLAVDGTGYSRIVAYVCMAGHCVMYARVDTHTGIEIRIESRMTTQADVAVRPDEMKDVLQ